MDSNTLNLSKCAGLINRLSSDEFTKLSELVYERYMNNCGNQTTFTSDITLSLNDDELSELQQRSTSSSFDINSLKRSMKILLNLFAEIAKSNIKPKTLKNLLSEGGWQAEKIEIFTNFWKSQAPKTIEILKNKSFDFSSNHLKNVNHKIKILSDHSCESEQKLPLVEIGFEFVNNNSTNNQFNSKLEDHFQASASNSSIDTNLTLNFTHQELLSFYDQLESIQNKIDKLYYK